MDKLRRSCLMSGVSMALALATAGAASASPALDLRRSDETWMLTNLLTGDRVALQATAPAFDFGDFQIGGPGAGRGQWEHIDYGGTRWRGRWSLGGARPADVLVMLTINAGTTVLRKQATITLHGGEPALLRSVVLDQIDAPAQALSHHGDWQSQPVLGKSFFFGIEFPVATTRVEGQRAILSHAPGRWVKPEEPFTSRLAVYGVASAGQARAAFEAYIAAMRPTPRGVHFNYNSWWTSPVPYTEADILRLVKTFGDHLQKPYGVSPDSFCIDMGWAKNTTLWQIDPTLFPNGFTRLDRACEGIRSNLGLWISPSGCYPQALDLAWAKGAGYEADSKACLGGPKYQAAFKRSLLDIITRYKLRHVKFDGYVPTCDAKDHGHEPGPLSAEPIADGIIDIFKAVHEAAPELWIEPTCFGYEPSPWWLMYCHSLIGTFGDDAPNGRVPCPTYRESYTTGRDYYNLKGARDILLPIAAQEVLGVVHQTAEPLQNDAVVTVLRGHQFLPLYINPAYMTPRRWEFVAALMKWARNNQDILANTRPILPESWRRAGGGPPIWQETQAPREPYGYAHWKGNRGLVCLRNPWIDPATVSIVPSTDVGLPADSVALRATTIYPERRVIAAHVDATEPLRVHLDPYETAVIEIGPDVNTPDTPRPVGVARPRLNLSVQTTRYEATGDGPAIGADFTRLWPGGGEHLRVKLSGDIKLPVVTGDVQAELLLLIEGPGPVLTPMYEITLGGEPAAAEFINSEAGWKATGSPPPEHWGWLRVPLPKCNSISSRLHLEATITLGDAGERLSGWVVGREATPWQPSERVDGTLLPGPEERYRYAIRAIRAAGLAGDLPVVREPAPMVRIKGVYLDTLEPVSVTQGWGKLQRNQSVWEKPITVAGKRYLRGLGTHATARIVYDLGGKYRRFQTWAGADQATYPTITMEVRVDGRSVWRSGLLTRDSPAGRVDVDVRGAQRLELLVGDGGNGIGGDHADWADAMLLY